MQVDATDLIAARLGNSDRLDIGVVAVPAQQAQPVVDQALCLLNSPKVMPLLQDEPGALLARLGAMQEAGPLAEELYLSVLARRPSPDEAAEVRQAIEAAKSPDERRAALQSLMWGLLLSAEFRLNH